MEHICQKKQSLAQQLFGKLNLAEMVIVFVMGAALFAIVIPAVSMLVAFLVSTSLPYLWPGAIHPINTLVTRNGDQIMQSLAGFWLLCVVGLWIVLVLQAKVDRETRVHDSDLKRLEWTFLGLIFVQGIAGSFGHVSIQDGLTVFETIEWVCIFLYCLYFLLALCVWVKVPLKQYFVFAIMIALAVLMGYWL